MLVLPAYLGPSDCNGRSGFYDILDGVILQGIGPGRYLQVQTGIGRRWVHLSYDFGRSQWRGRHVCIVIVINATVALLNSCLLLEIALLLQSVQDVAQGSMFEILVQVKS